MSVYSISHWSLRSLWSNESAIQEYRDHIHVQLIWWPAFYEIWIPALDGQHDSNLYDYCAAWDTITIEVNITGTPENQFQ